MILPRGGAHRAVGFGKVGASSTGTTVTAPTATNTMGAWTQLIASTGSDALGLMLQIRMGAGIGDDYCLVDVGVGAAGSEKIVAPSLIASQCNGGTPTYHYNLPILIPAGSAISARYQTEGANHGGPVRMSGQLLSGTFDDPLAFGGRVHALGPDLATSRGALVDPGATANTKGAYTQLTASTPGDIRGLIIALAGGDTNATAAGTELLLDLAIGAAASEWIFLPDVQLCMDDNFTPNPLVVGPFPWAIPAGTRVAARASATTNTAANRKLDLAVYGIG